MTASIVLRVATSEDLRFVRASWFESYRRGGFAPEVAFPVYRDGQGEVIERCIARSRTVIAYASAVPDEVCAWATLEGGTLHFIYTKHAYRGLGIARRLVYANLLPVETHTHDTRVGRSFTARIGSKFNPYSLFQGAK